MPLKVRIRPEGKLFVNGNGYIKNVGKRPIEVIVMDLIVDRSERREKSIAKLKEEIKDGSGKQP